MVRYGIERAGVYHTARGRRDGSRASCRCGGASATACGRR